MARAIAGAMSIDDESPKSMRESRCAREVVSHAPSAPTSNGTPSRDYLVAIASSASLRHLSSIISARPTYCICLPSELSSPKLSRLFIRVPPIASIRD
jgi:hypothetical protein